MAVILNTRSYGINLTRAVISRISNKIFKSYCISYFSMKIFIGAAFLYNFIHKRVL